MPAHTGIKESVDGKVEEQSGYAGDTESHKGSRSVIKILILTLVLKR